MELTEDIKYKVHFLLAKQERKEPLSKEEKAYLKKYYEFLEMAQSYQWKRELESFDIHTPRILAFLDAQEQEIKRTIPKTKSKRKLLDFQKALIKIQKLREGNLELFKYYLEDTYPYDRTKDINRYISSIIASDTYTATGSMNRYNTTSFHHKNNYTGEVTIQKANVLLAKEVLGGNMSHYEILRSAEGIRDVQARQQKLEELPIELRGASAEDVNRIVYYGRGRIGTPEESIFYNTGDILDYLWMLAQMKEETPSPEHETEIEDFALGELKRYLKGEIPEQKISRYAVLPFLPQGIYQEKFRNMLAAHNYNLTQLLEQIKQDDLISSTILNGSGSGLVEEGKINLPNVTLACELIHGQYTNYNLLSTYYKTGEEELLEQIPENLRNADPRHMSRIVYYGRGRIGNPENHDFDKDFYDLEILKALAEYQQSLSLEETKKVEVDGPILK